MAIKWKNYKYLILWLIAAFFLAFGLVSFTKSQNRIEYINGETSWLENAQKPAAIINDNLHTINQIYLTNIIKNFDNQTITEEMVTKSQLQAFKKQYLKDGESKQSDDELKAELIQKEAAYVNKHKVNWLNSYDYNPLSSYDYYVKMANGKILTNISDLKKANYRDAKQWLANRKGYLGVGKTTATISWLDDFIISPADDYDLSALDKTVVSALSDQSKIEAQVIIALKEDSAYVKSIQKNQTRLSYYYFAKYSGLFLIIAGLLILIYQFYQSSEIFAFWQKRSLELRTLILLITLFSSSYTTNRYNSSFKEDLTSAILLTIMFFITSTIIKNLIEQLRKNPQLPTLHAEWQTNSWTKRLMRRVNQFSLLPRGLIYGLSYLIVSATILVCLIYLYQVVFKFGILQLIPFGAGMAYLVVSMIYFIRYFKKINQFYRKPAEILNANGYEVPILVDLTSADHYLDEVVKLINQSKATTQKSEAFKNDLITNVSHDLRTPLTSIITYGDLLTQDDLSESDRKEYLAIINQKSARMKEMIEDLFEVIKMDHGDIVLNKSEINLPELVEQIIAENSELFEKNQLSLISKLPNQPVFIAIDGNQIWRVIENLLINAGKYSLEGSRIHIRLDDAPDQVHLTIKNTSKFLLDEDAEKLIERFGRGDRSRHSDGNGLGLAIVDSIIKLHEGTFQVIIDGDMFKVVIQLPKSI